MSRCIKSLSHLSSDGRELSQLVSLADLDDFLERSRAIPKSGTIGSHLLAL